MKWKIVTDSGCDWKSLDNLAPNTLFERVPLRLQIGNELFIDDEGLAIDQMMEKLYQTSSAASSSCPSPDAFLQAYQGAEHVIAITLTGGLSGTYNSARLAKDMLLESNKEVKIHLIDSLSAGGEIDLIVQKLNELIAEDLSFEEVVEAITAYQKKTKLLFVLAKVDNLVKNGRLSKLAGRVAGLLNIRIIGEASSDGKLELLHKSRGQKKAVQTVFSEMKKAGYNGGRVLIAHTNNEKICQQLMNLIQDTYPQATVSYLPTSGLCSFYAEDGGIMMGYEID